MNIHQKGELTALCETLASLTDPASMRLFLTDLCTPQELTAISQRFDVARLLWEGKNYKDIIEQTGASSATVSRVKRSIGEGYDIAFAAVAEEKKA